MNSRSPRLAVLLGIAAVALLPGCTDSAEPGTTSDSAASTTPTARPSGSPSAYCDSVRNALDVQPASGPIVRTATAKYADAVDRVVAVAPPEARDFWTATAKLSRAIADGGQGDMQTATDAVTKLPAAAQVTKSACGLDILVTKN
jgi:hypothetical protein